MNDPRRLLDESESAFEVKLLAAGKRDALPAARRKNMAAALGIGVGLPGTIGAHVHSAHRGWLVRAGELARSGWGIGGAIGGVSAAVVWSVLSAGPADSPSKSSVAAAARTSTAAERGAPAASPPPIESPNLTPPSATETNGASAVSTRASATTRLAAPVTGLEPSSLSEELAALDAARRQLSGGDAQRALRSLDDYARRFQRPRLTTEATVLRIEALVASGNRASAQRLGRAFLARQSNSPYERRVRSLLGDLKEPRPAAGG
jgi:hypothetical protein